MNMKGLKKAVVQLVAGALIAGGSLAAAQSIADLNNPPPGEWPQHGRDAAASRYSPLSQINTGNVSDLRLAWARDLDFRQTHQGTPTFWGGLLYVSTEEGVMAFNGATGDLVWEFSEVPEVSSPFAPAPRGGPIVYDGKVIFNLRPGPTVAVDARTGVEIWRTQTVIPELQEGFTSSPIFADGKIILGPAGADFGGAPGSIKALDVENGELLWTFDVVPMTPDDPAYLTWTNPPSWDDGIGGGSAWNVGAYDHVTRTVVYGTGQPTPWDRIDGRRTNEGEPSADLYTASFVGIDVDTGALRWYRQVVPGDEWDMDQHTVPMFADVNHNGEMKRVALLATTSGYFMVVDADTGELLRWTQGAEEVTIHLGFDEDGNAIVNPEARFSELGEFLRMCPGLRWAHIAPGAFSPDTGLWYRPNQMGCISYGPDVMPDDWAPGERAYWFEVGPSDDTHWFDRLGALTAYNPSTGEVVWEYGTDYGYDAGPVVTAGGLVFSAFTDRIFRAFDAATGEILWQQPLTAGSRAGTITYEMDGKQYVATMTGFAAASGAVIPDFNPNAGLPAVVLGNVSLFIFTLP
jgi:PQQ-dependent dehydrogenase (methanol/ethanol family)